MSNNRKPRTFRKGQWVKKRETLFVINRALSNNIPPAESRKDESYYGVVVSSEESNKNNTKVRVLFYPQGKIEEVMKSRLDFAEPPATIDASSKFLENFTTL